MERNDGADSRPSSCTYSGVTSSHLWPVVGGVVHQHLNQLPLPPSESGHGAGISVKSGNEAGACSTVSESLVASSREAIRPHRGRRHSLFSNCSTRSTGTGSAASNPAQSLPLKLAPGKPVFSHRRFPFASRSPHILSQVLGSLLPSQRSRCAKLGVMATLEIPQSSCHVRLRRIP